MAIGKVLRRWRQQRGLRQEDLEDRTGLAQAYLSDLERGDIKDPGFSKVARIVLVLERSLDELARVKDDDTAAKRQPAAA